MTDRQILDLITGSIGYKTTVGPVDQRKVQKALAGEPSVAPSSRLGRAAWELAKRVAPPVPPPPTYKRVAPLAAYAVDFSNGRFCLFTSAGVTRPGVTKQADGTYRDDVGHYDQDGLQLGAERDESFVAGLTSAKEIDGRDICSLPLVGDPTKNTGSWRI